MKAIIPSYFAAVTSETFVFNGRVYSPRPLSMSPLIFQRLNCVSHCGACCARFSLDYLPTEIRPGGCVPRQVKFAGRQVTILSDMQAQRKEHHCQHLNQEDGRCNIHTTNPFSCDFEIIRFFIYGNPQTRHRISVQPYGRAWAMKRIDGERGALCEIDKPVSWDELDSGRREVIRKLLRLKEWTDHFGLFRTKIPRIVDFLEGVELPMVHAKVFDND